MASGQKVIGRHEVFEYTYRMGPAAEERKRIKLVVIQRREQRRKSQIGVSKHLGTPVRLRVNLHRAQYGDPEIVSGSRHVPITLRRKVKPAPNTTVLRHGHGTRAPATTVVRAPVSASPPPPEPTRIELVDSPVGSYVDDPPPPIVVVPPSQTPTPEPRAPSLVRTGSGSSIGRKPKRSNSITSGFRRFPSLMGMIRRNSKSSTPPSVAASEEQHVIIPGNYHDRELPQTPESLVIVEERESELGSPIGTSVRYGPPSVADTSISRRRPPPTVESLGSSRSGRSRNKLIKPPPHQVPLPDSLRHSDGTGTVASGYPVHLRQSAEYEPARSVTSRHTGEQRLITGPEYAETYLHDSPSAPSRSLRDESVRSRSIHDSASARSHNRSLHDLHNRSAHELSQHSQHSRSVHDLSMRTPSRHSHEASIRDGSLRDGVSLHELGGAPSLRGESVRDPSIREHSIRDPSIREHSLRGGGSIRDGGLYSPSASMREVLSEGDRENDHTYDYERGPHPHSRVASPSLHAPSTRVASPGYYRDGSPSIHAPSHRAMSPSVLAPSHRGASPSLHAPSYRGASPSLHAPSRGASPSLHDPSMRGGSPPVSMHAPSERSRVAPSVVSSKYPPSSINGRHGAPGGFGRPKSPLSASGSSHASSRRTGGPRGPDITAVPLPPPSVRSVNTATTRNGLKSPHTRVASPPISEAPIIPSRSAPSVDGSFRSGRASELPYQATLPPSTYAPSAISRAPSAAPTSRAPSAAGTRIPTSSRAPSAAGIPTALSAGTFHSAVSDAPSRTTSAAGTHITRAPSAAGVPLPSSVGTPTVYAPSEGGYSRAPSAAGPRITRVPSAAGVALPASVAGSTIYAPSTIGRARSPSVAGTQITRAPSAAGVPLPPSVVGSPTVYAPSARGHSRAPSVAGTQITRATSAARVPLPASVAGGSTVYAPSAGGHSRAPSAAAISRAPSAGPRITRVPSAAGTHRHAPSVSVSQRIPPSVIGSQRVPPSIAGSAPSRHTPPPESEFLPAQSDIAPESESHGGQALRAQARLEGDKMGMFFQMASQAHKDGDGAKAKELSDIGRQHQVRMQELNAEAASQIFKEKNVGRDENEIDLHGLYVKEALARLSQFIREAPRSGQTSLRIITGKGLHSDRGEAQIIPAVEESLRTKGLRHHTDESNAGVIVVELGPRSPVSD